MHIRPVRHPLASVFQSIIDHVLHRQAPEETRPTLDDPHVHAATIVAEHIAEGADPPHEAPPPVQRVGGGSQAWRCMKLAGELFMAKLEHRTERVTQLENELKDGTCDPRWAEAIAEYLEYYGLSGHKRTVPYIPCRHPTDFVSEVLPASATILLIGDWATGTEPAKALLREAATHAPDLFIHLGDIYYAGTHHEAQANFLDICNEVFDRSSGHLPIYNLTGNHDMYAGGVGYFDSLSKLNPSPPFLPEQAQSASFFCLRNNSNAFQLLAMDTGLHDGDPFTVSTDVTWLEPAEAAWHLDKINEFHERGGKTILLSHHQLFTAFDPIGAAETRPADLQAYNPKLLETFREVLEAGKVLVWFWGHEHNMALYQSYGPLARGRCIGHGAIPVMQDADPYAANPRIANPPQLVRHSDSGELVTLPLDAGGMYKNGYVILRLNDATGSAAAEYYVAGEPNRALYREELS